MKVYIVNGFTGSIKQIAEHFNIKYTTLKNRLYKGMSIEEAINTPIEERKEIKTYIVNSFTGNLRQIAKHFNVNYGTLCGRIYRGWSIERAVNTPVNEQKERKIEIYTVNGFTGSSTQIAKHFNIKNGTLRDRINKQGMSMEDAVNTTVRENEKIYTVNGFTGNLTQIAKHFNISYTVLRQRLHKGFTIEEAVLFQKEYYGQKKE